MGTKKEEMKGRWEQTAGGAQRRVGEAFGDEELRAEGEGRHAKGRVRQEAARTARQLKNAGNRALGKILRGRSRK